MSCSGLASIAMDAANGDGGGWPSDGSSLLWSDGERSSVGPLAFGVAGFALNDGCMLLPGRGGRRGVKS